MWLRCRDRTNSPRGRRMQTSSKPARTASWVGIQPDGWLNGTWPFFSDGGHPAKIPRHTWSYTICCLGNGSKGLG